MTGTIGATATPTAPPDSSDAAVVGLELVAFGILSLLTTLVVWAMLRRLSAEEPGVVVPFLVALVTMTALGLFAITREEGLQTIAATGTGALAGALAHLFTARHDDDDLEDDDLEDDNP